VRVTVAEEGGLVSYFKGAPEVLLHRSVLSNEERESWAEKADADAREGFRVLALAWAEGDTEESLTLIGLALFWDPPRPEVPEAVRTALAAGIRVIMVTGDHPATALAVAHQIGIPGMRVLTGEDLDDYQGAALIDALREVNVFARVRPEQKLQLVEALQAQGQIVAMTGDGVNDAPAIKAADIGIAMGLSGTDVTKEAADMVVTDDNFASIAAAVEEGRGVFDNIRKTVHFLLSCNLSEVLVMLFATLLGLPLPLLPIQILWMNLVTDGIPALALAVDPKAPDLMKRPPRRPEARLLDGGRLLAIGGEGLMLGLIALGAFSYSLYGLHQELDQARTVAFTVMVVAQLVHVFNCRSERLSLFQLGVGTNRALVWAFLLSLVVQVAVLTIPVVAPIFKVASLPIEDWVLMGAMGLLPFVMMESIKLVRRR